MAYQAIDGGAAGVDMGRNIFQSDHPVAMIRAIRAVVHESAKPEQAYEEFVRPAISALSALPSAEASASVTKEARP
jgi:pyridoxal biosynthesis lyase PdxS